MKWSVSVGVRLSIEYDDIEAETQEDAEEIAIERALEDVDYNNASCDENDTIVYASWSNDEEEEDDVY
jgi:hypothetical protein